LGGGKIMKFMRLVYLITIIFLLLMINSCNFFQEMTRETSPPEKNQGKIVHLTEAEIKTFIGMKVGDLLPQIAIPLKKKGYFQEPPGLWAGCNYFFSNGQGLHLMVDEFRYHDQRDIKSPPRDEEFTKETITNFQIFEWNPE
jgi:hypothetical protein